MTSDIFTSKYSNDWTSTGTATLINGIDKYETLFNTKIYTSNSIENDYLISKKDSTWDYTSISNTFYKECFNEPTPSAIYNLEYKVSSTDNSSIYNRDATFEWKWSKDKLSTWSPPVDPLQRMREIIRSRQSPFVISTRRAISPLADLRELRARQTLRRVLGESQFRSFLRNGFVTVTAKSGKTYQIFTGSAMTSVYVNGKMIEKLCVVLNGVFPPTDSLIVRYLMILNNEDEFRSYAIQHNVYQHNAKGDKTERAKSLPEIFAEIKAAA